MKYAALLVALLGVVPTAFIMQRDPRLQRGAWIALGLFPFLLPALQQLDVAIVGTPGWTGHVHGLEVSLSDFIALALLVSMPRRSSALSYSAPMAFYLGALILASIQAAHPLEASYAVFQFARMCLLVAVVARGCLQNEVPILLMKGLALGVALELIVMVVQLRAGTHIQPPGTFAHQNTLGMVVHFVALPHFALFLSGARGMQFLLVPTLSVSVAILTASRAAFVLCLLGFGLTYAASMLRRTTARKAIVGVVALFAVAGAAPLAISSFERRFSNAPLTESEYDERAAFNRAAIAIVADYPWGVGPNHYVYVAKNFGYSHRAGVAPVESNLNNIVHNVYLLAAVETGYLGVLALLGLLGYPMLVAARYAVAAGVRPAGDLLAGSGIAIGVVCVHSGYEYILLGQDVQYVFGITIGIIFGVSSRIANLVLPTRRNFGSATTRTGQGAGGQTR